MARLQPGVQSERSSAWRHREEEEVSSVAAGERDSLAVRQQAALC